jgi:hypothetical protein
MLERAVFVIEPSGERVSCMLNPNQLVFRRSTGFVARRSLAGAFSAVHATDDELLFTGGAVTELLVDLVFDVTLPGSSNTTQDVSELTRPLWTLAEAATFDTGYRQPSFARFIWGKAWNFLAVVAEAAQRFEHFATDGTPRRCWLRLRLVRVPEIETADGAGVVPVDGDGAVPELPDDGTGAAAAPEPADPTAAPASDDPPTQRLDVVAFQNGLDPADWRDIALANDVVDPLNVPWGQALHLPDEPTEAEGGAG